MRRLFVVLAFSTGLAFLPALAYAQRGGGMAGHAAAAPASHVAMRAAPSTPHFSAAPRASSAGHYVRTRSGALAYRSASRGAFLSPTSRTNGSRRLLSSDVPGLGFDYPHLAAIGGGRGHGRGFLPGRDRNRPFRAYFPFFGGGYYLPLYDDYYDDSAAPEDEQAETIEPDSYPGYPSGYPAPPRPGDTPEGLPAPAPAAAASATTPERLADQYVFVRRDGTLFFAVAYTWDSGNLRYVTSEGLRRSVAENMLDLDATQQFNEQRGLSFRIPAA